MKTSDRFLLYLELLKLQFDTTKKKKSKKKGIFFVNLKLLKPIEYYDIISRNANLLQTAYLKMKNKVILKKKEIK